MKEIVIFFSDSKWYLCKPDSFSESETQLGNILANLSPQRISKEVIINIDDKKILVIYPEEEIPENEKKSIIPQDIQTMFLAFHETTMKGISENIISQLKKNFQNVKIYWSFYSHICDETSLWKVFSDLLWALYRCNQRCNQREAIKYFDKLSDLIKKKPIVSNFSLLKHRIAHLFLPLDIDLQGIGEVEGKKVKIKENNKEIEKDAQVAYLEEVLKAKNKNYKQKLADLWYSVTGRDFDRKVNDCEIPKAQEDWKKLVNENKAIIDLIKESGKQNKVKDLWEILLNLCGINYDSGSSQYSVINSPILGFMCLMDKKIGKDMIEKGDVEEILNYFSKLNDKKGWKVKGANPEVIKSFHDWFCALMDCLDKIRKRLKDEQGK
jgi:hypothetical protein